MLNGNSPLIDNNNDFDKEIQKPLLSPNINNGTDNYNLKNNSSSSSSSSIMTVDSPNNGATHVNRQLKKNALGLAHVLAMSVSGIGPTTGIYFVWFQIAVVAGTAVPFTLIIASICCLSMASTISTYAKYISTSASFYSYVSKGLGKEMGFLTGWLMLLGYMTLTAQTVIQFSSTMADVITNNTGFKFPWIVGGAIITILISTLAYIGINPALKISLFLVSGETLITAIFTIIIVIKGGEEGNYPLALTPAGPYSGGISGISRGLVYSVLVFVGFEAAAILGQETRNPNKSIPRAVVGSVLLTAAWMVWAFYAMVVATGYTNIFNVVANHSSIHEYAKKFIGTWMAILIDIAGISSTLNVCTCAFNNLFRITYSVGKSNVNPTLSKLSLTSKRYSTPKVAIIVITIYLFLACTIAAATFGIYTSGSWEVYGYLSYIGTIPLILVFIITNISVIPYMKKQQPQDFHIFYHLILPVFSALLFIGVLVGNFYPIVPQPPYSYLLIVLAVLILVGVGIMFFLRTKIGLLEKMEFMISSDGSNHDNCAIQSPIIQSSENIPYDLDKDNIKIN